MNVCKAAWIISCFKLFTKITEALLCFINSGIDIVNVCVMISVLTDDIAS